MNYTITSVQIDHSVEPTIRTVNSLIKSGGDCKIVKIGRRDVTIRPDTISKHMRKKSPGPRTVGRVIRIGSHEDALLKDGSPI